MPLVKKSPAGTNRVYPTAFRHLKSLLPMAFIVAGCAQLPTSIAELHWRDSQGDRGRGVLARDYDMCEQLVEQRRSLMEGCMASRGWSVLPD